MGSKLQPDEFDCYNNALPDEETFTLLARDPSFPNTVHRWAEEREAEINAGRRPESDRMKVAKAHQSAERARLWRIANDGKWRCPDLFGREISEEVQNDALLDRK